MTFGWRDVLQLAGVHHRRHFGQMLQARGRHSLQQGVGVGQRLQPLQLLQQLVQVLARHLLGRALEIVVPGLPPRQFTKQQVVQPATLGSRHAPLDAGVQLLLGGLVLLFGDPDQGTERRQFVVEPNQLGDENVDDVDARVDDAADLARNAPGVGMRGGAAEWTHAQQLAHGLMVPVERPMRLRIRDLHLRGKPHAGRDVLDNFGRDLFDRAEEVQVLEALELNHQGEAAVGLPGKAVDPFEFLRGRAEQPL